MTHPYANSKTVRPNAASVQLLKCIGELMSEGGRLMGPTPGGKAIALERRGGERGEGRREEGKPIAWGRQNWIDTSKKSLSKVIMML